MAPPKKRAKKDTKDTSGENQNNKVKGMPTSKSYPGMTEKVYPEKFDIRAMPKPSLEKKPGQLSVEEVRHFFEKGYLIVPKFFPDSQLRCCRDDVATLVDELADKLFAAGKIKDLHKDKGLFQRLSCLEEEFPGANILIHKQGKLMKSFADLWSDDRLLNVIEQLIGPEIMGHPVWNVRTKVPQNEETTVPWHQDSAYLDNDSYSVLQPAAWIPLLDANEKNGCMEVVSGGHLAGKVARHTCCWGNTWYIMLQEQDIDDALGVTVAKDKVLCEVPYGGMLLINNLIPHRSLNNLSNDIRWSFDFRWQRPNESTGFWGLKDGVLMRSVDKSFTGIDWDTFNSVERHAVYKDKLQDTSGEEEFDTTLVGPWMMGKWEMTNTNRHTEKMLADSKMNTDKA